MAGLIGANCGDELRRLRERESSLRSVLMNPHAETWVQRTKHEVRDHFIVFGERHMRRLLSSWLDYYHKYRPHQGIDNVPLDQRDGPSPVLTDTGPPGEIVCHEALGGLLKHYRRKAA